MFYVISDTLLKVSLNTNKIGHHVLRYIWHIVESDHHVLRYNWHIVESVVKHQ